MARTTPPGVSVTPPRCAHAPTKAVIRPAKSPGGRMPYTSCSSAMSLISIPTSVRVSVTISAGKAGATGRTDQMPTVAPTAADAREAPSIRASASSSGDLPGNWARSVAWSRTGRRGARASTSPASQRLPRCTPRPARRVPRPTTLAPFRGAPDPRRTRSGLRRTRSGLRRTRSGLRRARSDPRRTRSGLRRTASSPRRATPDPGVTPDPVATSDPAAAPDPDAVPGSRTVSGPSATPDPGTTPDPVAAPGRAAASAPSVIPGSWPPSASRRPTPLPLRLTRARAERATSFNGRPDVGCSADSLSSPTILATSPTSGASAKL